MKVFKAAKELVTFAAIMVGLLLALSGKANSSDSVDKPYCVPTDVVRTTMAEEQFRMVRIDFDKDWALVTYTRFDEVVQWVFLPSGKACLFRERQGGI